jgi:hypothetical protein
VFFCCKSLLRLAELPSFVSMLLEEDICLDRWMCGCDTSQASRRCLKMDDALMMLEEDICLDRGGCVCVDVTQVNRLVDV